MKFNEARLPTRSEWSAPDIRSDLETGIRALVLAGDVVAINAEEVAAEVSLPGRNFVLARGGLYAEVMDRFGIGWVKVA